MDAIFINTEIIVFLKERNINFYSATLQNSTSYHTQDYTLPTALIVGTEATLKANAYNTTRSAHMHNGYDAFS